LIGIRERVAHLRGTVHIDTGPGRGTRLTIELPARVRAKPIDAREFETTDITHPITGPEVLLG
jgi:signal transduction histidine kinase